MASIELYRCRIVERWYDAVVVETREGYRFVVREMLVFHHGVEIYQKIDVNHEYLLLVYNRYPILLPFTIRQISELDSATTPTIETINAGDSIDIISGSDVRVDADVLSMTGNLDVEGSASVQGTIGTSGFRTNIGEISKLVDVLSLVAALGAQSGTLTGTSLAPLISQNSKDVKP